MKNKQKQFEDQGEKQRKVTEDHWVKQMKALQVLKSNDQKTGNKFFNVWVTERTKERDTSPIIGQRKWLYRAYLKKICKPGWKQNLWIRRSFVMWLIKIIRQIKVITVNLYGRKSDGFA